VVDDNGYELLSSVPKLGQPTDSIPPSCSGQPDLGSCNRSGVATLTWSRSSEPDVMGYRVFLSNMQEGDFVQITTTWINDTTVYHYGLNLNTLSEEVYFVRSRRWIFEKTCPSLRSVCLVQPPRHHSRLRRPASRAYGRNPEKYILNGRLSSSEDVVDYEFQRKPEWSARLGRRCWTFDHDPEQNPPLAFTDSTASVRRYWDYRLHGPR
jgi:hypothetical protein